LSLELLFLTLSVGVEFREGKFQWWQSLAETSDHQYFKGRWWDTLPYAIRFAEWRSGQKGYEFG
jgi:hypothetical protein